MRVKLTVEEINNFIDLWEYYKGISFRKNVSIHTRECRKTAKTTTRELWTETQPLKLPILTIFVILSNNYVFALFHFHYLTDWENKKPLRLRVQENAFPKVY